MVEAIELQPSVAVQEGDVLFFPLEEIQPAITSEAQKSYHVFRTESIVATICIVTVGSLATYFASGYVLKPLTLSQEVENAMQPIWKNKFLSRKVRMKFNN